MKVLEVFEKNLRVKNYSKRTIETYSSYVKRYIREVNSLDPYQLTTKQLNEYLLNFKYSSTEQQNQIINSLKLFYKYIAGSKVSVLDIERPRKEKRLPQIIDKYFV